MTGLLLLTVLGLSVAGRLSASAQDTFPPPPVDDSTLWPRVAVVTVRATDAYASEPGILAVIDDGKFVISRSYHTNIDMTVYYRLSGTASNGVDYEIPGTPNQVVIPKGKWEVEVPVRALFDNLAESTETVVMELAPVLCAAVYPPPPGCYQIGQPARATVYIRDSQPSSQPPFVKITEPAEGAYFEAPVDIPIVAGTMDPDGYCWRAEFFADGRKIGEQSVAFFVAPPNGSPFDFDCTWKNAPVGRHTLTAQTTDSQGNIGVSEPVRIVVGPVPTPAPVVSVVASEPVAIEATNCWGWWSLTNRFPDGAVQYTNRFAWPGPRVWWYTNCGPKNATFTIRRNGATNDDLEVFFRLRGTATNGMDYELIGNSVTILAGTCKADVLIVPKQDAILEPPETVILELLPPHNSALFPLDYDLGYPSRAGAVILERWIPRPRPVLLPGRFFHWGAIADDTSWWRIERSTDLRNWEILSTNQVLQGELNYIDPDAEKADTLFYRSTPVPAPPED